jgi:hypothetical protein
MKRLLIFVLVLSMTAAVNAALTFRIDGFDPGDAIDVMAGYTITIQIHDDVTTQAGYNGQVILDLGSDGTIGNGQIYMAAGSAGAIMPYYYAPYGLVGYNLTSMSISDDISAGVHFSVDYTAPVEIGPFSATLSLYDGRVGYAKVDSLAINIPEPATLVALGLGGLSLFRRRRK